MLPFYDGFHMSETGELLTLMENSQGANCLPETVGQAVPAFGRRVLVDIVRAESNPTDASNNDDGAN